MPTVSTTNDSGINSAEIEQKLRKGYFVKRGDVMKAFGLSRTDMEALVPAVFIPAPGAVFKRARFVRSQVMAVARSWEAASRVT